MGTSSKLWQYVLDCSGKCSTACGPGKRRCFTIDIPCKHHHGHRWHLPTLCCCCRDGAACRQFHCPLPQGGGIISQVRDRTGAKVHMCDAEPGRPDRIITISLIDGQR